MSTFTKTEQLLVSRRGFGSLHPWPSAQYCAYCLPALSLVRGIRRAAPAQVTACRVVTKSYSFFTLNLNISLYLTLTLRIM